MIPEKPETNFEVFMISLVLITVSKLKISFLTVRAITISSRDALPALSPKPLIVHSICRAPFSKPAIEFATARPKSL